MLMNTIFMFIVLGRVRWFEVEIHKYKLLKKYKCRIKT